MNYPEEAKRDPYRSETPTNTDPDRYYVTPYHPGDDVLKDDLVVIRQSQQQVRDSELSQHPLSSSLAPNVSDFIEHPSAAPDVHVPGFVEHPLADERDRYEEVAGYGRENNHNVNRANEYIPRRVCVCLVCILGLVIAVGGAIALGVSVSHTKHKSILNQIGEDPFLSPHITTLSSSISSLTITLINLPQHSTITAMVYIDNMLPVKTTDYLLPKAMRPLTGLRQPSRYNYNYNDGDNPVYLLDGFKLIYELSIGTVISNSTSYSTRLALFNDVSDYYTYINNGIVTPLAMSPPLKVGIGMPIKSTWTFNITEPSSYYVALQVPEQVLVNSNASVVGVYYNTTGLDSPSDCSEPLSVHHPSCEVHVCQEFYCNYISSMYLLVDSTDNVTVKFDFTSTNINSKGHFAGFIVGLILIMFSIILVIVIILCCKCCR